MLQRVLFVNGTCGVGKTTISAAAAALIADAGGAIAFVDMDALGQSWPRSIDDPFNQALGIRNLAALAENFAEAGFDSLVIAGVIRDAED